MEWRRVLNQESKYFQWVFKALNNIGEMWWSHSEVPTIYNVKVVSFCLVHGCTKIQIMNANPQSPVPFHQPLCAVPTPAQVCLYYCGWVFIPSLCGLRQSVLHYGGRLPSVVHSECSFTPFEVRHKVRSTSLGCFVVHIRKCHLHKPIAVTLLYNPHIPGFVVDQMTNGK